MVSYIKQIAISMARYSGRISVSTLMSMSYSHAVRRRPAAHVEPRSLGRLGHRRGLARMVETQGAGILHPTGRAAPPRLRTATYRQMQGFASAPEADFSKQKARGHSETRPSTPKVVFSSSLNAPLLGRMPTGQRQCRRDGLCNEAGRHSNDHSWQPYPVHVTPQSRSGRPGSRL